MADLESNTGELVLLYNAAHPVVRYIVLWFFHKFRGPAWAVSSYT